MLRKVVGRSLVEEGKIRRDLFSWESRHGVREKCDLFVWTLSR
jgi:hypothetical protein